MNAMEQKVLDLIKKYYKKEYIGGLKVTELGIGGYRLILDLGIPDKRPISIAAELNAEDFIKFIEKELIARQLQKVQFFRGIKTDLEDDELGGTCQKNGQCDQ